MRKTISILCVIVLIFSCIPAAVADTGWQQAYLDILKETVIVWEPQVDDVAVENSYFVYDFEKDGTPELVVKTGTCEADYMLAVFSYRDGQAVRVGEIGAAHSSFYGDPVHGGLIQHQGHSGYAGAYRYRISGGEITFETLFEDNLYERLPDDPDAEYIPVTDVVPEAVPLTLVESYNPLGITHYDEICDCLTGSFPTAGSLSYPADDPSFYTKVISNGTAVFAAGTSRFANTPGFVSFRDLLKKDVAASWMSGDLIISDVLDADLNGDGKFECILSLTDQDGGSPIRFFLCEEGGVVYAYIQNYAYDSITVDDNGNFLLSSDYYQQRYRLIFENENSFLLMLPT